MNLLLVRFILLISCFVCFIPRSKKKGNTQIYAESQGIAVAIRSLEVIGELLLHAGQRFKDRSEKGEISFVRLRLVAFNNRFQRGFY